MGRLLVFVYERLKGRRGAGGDDDELAVAGVAEAVRLAAVEEIGVAGGKLVAAAVDFERQPAISVSSAAR